MLDNAQSIILKIMEDKRNSLEWDIPTVLWVRLFQPIFFNCGFPVCQIAVSQTAIAIQRYITCLCFQSREQDSVNVKGE